MYTTANSRIISIGKMLPQQRISSEQLMRTIDSVNNYGLGYEWLERTTGVKERRCADATLLPSDMAVIAAREAMDKARIMPSDISMIIYAGVIRDHALEPSTAHIVQEKLGAKHAYVLDMNNACMGFVSAMHIMDALIASNQCKIGLIVTGEQGMQFTNKAVDSLRDNSDREQFNQLVAGLTLGDAGAAMLMGSKNDPATGFLGFEMESRGEYAKLCYCGDKSEVGLLYTDMYGMRSAAEQMIMDTAPDFISKRMAWDADLIDHFVAHQVGYGTLKIYTKYLHIPRRKMTETVWNYGNLISATIPVNLCQLLERKPKIGDKVLIAGSGSGFCTSYASLIWDSYTEELVL